ncbi:sigma-70 family RNA polymerase sigma factor [Dactylosporangium siamense]|uniref:RNA polymerase sigma factor n=1 Tax=Dactylosporangium siamense TaxID=685454 RepID=A0A919UCY9_9ACTN|nr:RNA polymerase sigma factor [Dactylosporangium siamense]
MVEEYRRELEVHCYRMLGSLHEAEDLVQETYLKAWRARDGFDGRSSVRTWLYRIATNACLDALKARPRRALPVDLGSDEPALWLEPIPDTVLNAAQAGPEAALVAKEGVELAFLAALQHLPPRQRAVLILRDVLEWPAAQTATLLDMTVPAVNSALQRAKTRMPAPSKPATAAEHEVARRYADAFQRGDIPAMVRLLADEVRASMPPLRIWYRGRTAVEQALRESRAALGEVRVRCTAANRRPAMVSHIRPPGETDWQPFAVGILHITAGRITELVAFHDPAVVARFDR